MNESDNRFATDTSDIDLSVFDDDFSSAESSDFDEVPDGKYQVRINTVRLDKSRKGDPMIKWDLIVISGNFTDRHLFKNSVITPAALPFVKGDLKTVGLTLTKFSELQGRLEELLDVTLDITKRTRGEYTNVYFNKRLQLATGAVSRGSNDDVPF